MIFEKVEKTKYKLYNTDTKTLIGIYNKTNLEQITGFNYYKINRFCSNVSKISGNKKYSNKIAANITLRTI